MLQDRNIYPFLYLSLSAIFVLWAFFQHEMSMRADAIWLSYAAEQFMAGKALSEYYFDTNPPMCFLVYIPVIWLKSLGMPLWTAHFLYTLLLITLSVLNCVYLLSRWPLERMLRFIIIGSYIFGSTILISIEFGQKDHLITLALLPFVLSQLSLMKSIGDHKEFQRQRAIPLIIMIFWAPFILIKPHYGLLPCSIIAYRFFKNRSLRSIFQEDFFVLSAATILYIGVVLYYFGDFITIVLPFSFDFYIDSRGDAYESAVFKTLATLALSLFLIIFALCADKATHKEKELCTLFCVLSALCVIPYWIQGKGFLLHYLPVIMTMSIAVFSIGWLYLRNLSSQTRAVLVAGFMGLLVVTSLIYKPSADNTHDYFKNHPLKEELGFGKDMRAFFIENNSTNVSQPIAAYNGLAHASRFSANWFTLNSNFWDQADHKRELTTQILGNYIAEDIERYKPEIMLFIDDERFPSYLRSLKEHTEFQASLSNYELAKHLDNDSILRFGTSEQKEALDKVRYALYKRKASVER